MKSEGAKKCMKLSIWNWGRLFFQLNALLVRAFNCSLLELKMDRVWVSSTYDLTSWHKLQETLSVNLLIQDSGNE